VGVVLWKRFQFDYQVSFTPAEIERGIDMVNGAPRPYAQRRDEDAFDFSMEWFTPARSVLKRRP